MTIPAKYLILALLASNASAATPWKTPLRGANSRSSLTADDVRQFAAFGGNVLRIGCNTRPLMDKQPPYAFNEENFRLLDQAIDHCEKAGVRVVIDPHTTPGTERPTTTLPNDELWKDFTWHNHLIRLWEKIARRYAGRGDVIAGYDLLNEPGLPNGGQKDTPADWNLLVRKLVKTIRAADTRHTIIIDTPVVVQVPGGNRLNRLQGINYLEAPPDANVVYSPHMYEPGTFTHQGVEGRPNGIRYPGPAQGKEWNRATMEAAFQPVLAFARRYNATIFMGEFSAPRWQGEDGNRYLRDVIELCEQYGWSWAYHSYREADVWDGERDNFNANDHARKESTPRLELLKEFFGRNRRPAAAGGGG